MSREYCPKCEKALGGCICKYATEVVNDSFITILRHPSEIKNIKGTAGILKLSLQRTRLIDSEIFEKDDVLLKDFENILIYPSKSSCELTQVNFSKNKSYNFIFIDGTWKKAFKIFQLNSFLSEIPCIHLELERVSSYSKIRKQREGGFSTLEAVTEVLSFVDNTPLENLENNFKSFINDLSKFTDS
ncbi:tRNA-uridine aminocarboxypropyltransferase [Halobacteriovorax marinus]|uniref:tRNA-uridine aminocarboxypropyltransferase n=1 Tax=Halobacteriovorax marinus TaxID=97084 RepID=UPI003A912CE2